MAFVSVRLASPAVHIRMSSQVLTSDTVCARIRVQKASLQNDWLQVPVEHCDHAGLKLINLVQFEIFRQMNNLGSLNRQANVKVRLQFLSVHSHKHVAIV